MGPENDVLNWFALLPPSVTALIVIAGAPAEPVCVSVTGKVFVPLLSVPKFSVLGDRLIVAVGTDAPVPLRLMVIGDVLEPVCPICRTAFLPPVDVGLKVTLTTAVCPRFRVTGVAIEATN